MAAVSAMGSGEDDRLRAESFGEPKASLVSQLSA
jgi:hypothetical protein